MSPRNLTVKCLPKTNGEKYIYTEMIQMFISTSFTIVPNETIPTNWRVDLRKSSVSVMKYYFII